MLKIGAPVEIRRVFEVDGAESEVAFLVCPPTRSTLKAARAAQEEGEEAFEAFWGPERVAQHVVDWRGVADADGNPLPVSKEALEAVREDCPPLYNAAVAAIFESLPRKREADRKNSRPSPGGTSAPAGEGA